MIDAVRFIAENGWRFLPLYKVDVGTGEWHPISIVLQVPVGRTLRSIDFFHDETVSCNEMLDSDTSEPASPRRRAKWCKSPKNVSLISARDEAAAPLIPTPTYTEMLTEARKLAENIPTMITDTTVSDDAFFFSPRVTECGLRWFALPSEGAILLKTGRVAGDDNTSKLVLGATPGTVNLLPFFGKSASKAQRYKFSALV